MKRIAITGGAGFIGSHLCEYLLNQSSNNEVICLDNFFTGSKRNINHLFANPNFILVTHDVSLHLPELGHIDEIYNLACPASPVHYQKNPVRTIRTSVLGAINCLELAMTTGAKILQASTSEIYGDPLEHPQKESYNGNVNVTGIRSCYDESKRCAETLFMDYYRERNVKSKIIRISNTYGPRMQPDDGRVISNFIMQALHDEDITVYGDGSQTRSFMYIDNLIDGMVKMMDTEVTFTGPVNIGSTFEFKISELVMVICDLTNSLSKVIYKPLPSDDPKRRQLDCSLAKEKLGWEATINLVSGLIETIKYFEKLK